MHYFKSEPKKGKYGILTLFLFLTLKKMTILQNNYKVIHIGHILDKGVNYGKV